ncbi:MULTISPECIES: helix-turn-helix domain-containing protein [Sodalis]|uniref:Helix-turn-helix protein n=1 Tax=Sodalis ligni TaxID=2697027 RepID=A0A4R1N6E1_9GAMM|nr:AraC family transcriptional regulator [Sodalis ligni]TCL02107.1 helix-turn-helix protein [Sodalis ligni]
MKPQYEKVQIDMNSSWSLFDRILDKGIPFLWHHHPEYEITLTLNSYGRKYLGSEIRSYSDNDLVLLGPNVPHSWHSYGKINPSEPHRAVVMWFSTEWIEKIITTFPEMTPLKIFRDIGQQSVIFSLNIATSLREDIISMASDEGPERLIRFITILYKMTKDSKMEFINVSEAKPTLNKNFKDERVNQLIAYIHDNYSERIKIDTLAEMACVSISAFHRMFKKHTNRTATEYINQLRINHACNLLIISKKPISLIAEEVGYSSLALFNRHFREYKHTTPSAWRKGFYLRFSDEKRLA